MLSLFVTLSLSASACDLGIIGAGPGGAYVAWRYAAENPSGSVCLFEQGTRVGGRVHSMRHQGPKRDLVVEAGAYRFAPNASCFHFGNFTYCIDTPLTSALILDALKLPTKPYNPLPGQFDSLLVKIVDANGHDAGYLTFVEAMATAPLPNLRVMFKHEALSVASSSGDASGDLTIKFANGAAESVHRLVFNVPQRPLLRILGNSPSLFSGSAAPAWPAALTYPLAYPIVKLYLHYEDAWWRNDLGFVSGHFNNSAMWKTNEGPMAHPRPSSHARRVRAQRGLAGLCLLLGLEGAHPNPHTTANRIARREWGAHASALWARASIT